MTGLEELLKQVVAQGDLRRKEAKLLEEKVCTLCDQIGTAAQKAGVWGKYIHVNLGSVDAYDERGFIAYLSSGVSGVEISPKTRKVVVRLAEAWEQEMSDGYKEFRIDPCNEYWTQHPPQLAWRPSRALTVELAHRLEDLAQLLLGRCQQLAHETQAAREKVEELELVV